MDNVNEKAATMLLISYKLARIVEFCFIVLDSERNYTWDLAGMLVNKLLGVFHCL